MRLLIGVMMLATTAGAPAFGAPAGVPGKAREALQPLLSCRSEADAAARLACYDSATDALRAATERRDVVVVDKAEVQKARRSLFGFAMPDLGLFRSDSADTPEEREINATVRSAQEGRDGNWMVTLDTGATWAQTDGKTVARAPRAGDTVTIRRAALGSYFMRIGRQPGVKAKRIG